MDAKAMRFAGLMREVAAVTNRGEKEDASHKIWDAMTKGEIMMEDAELLWTALARVSGTYYNAHKSVCTYTYDVYQAAQQEELERVDPFRRRAI